jgi:hypothetical protein
LGWVKNANVDFWICDYEYSLRMYNSIQTNHSYNISLVYGSDVLSMVITVPVARISLVVFIITINGSRALCWAFSELSVS